MTTFRHAHVLEKMIPCTTMSRANWPVAAQVITPPPIAGSNSSAVASLSGGVYRVPSRQSLTRDGVFSTSSTRRQADFPFHSRSKDLTKSLNGNVFSTFCRRASQEQEQEPINSGILAVKNEDAEEQFKAPVAHLRSLLHLWDAHTDTNLFEIITVADYLERFGLDIYFREEVKSILDSLFRIWTDCNSGKSSLAAAGLGDLKYAALAFYLLRSHEYEVSPGLLRSYRMDDGKFSHRAGEGTSPDLIDLLNLCRASDLRFRRDADLQEAFKFSSTTLQGLVDVRKDSLLSDKAIAEIKYRLKYPWNINLRAMETRQTVLNFRRESVEEFWYRLSTEVTSLMLALATQHVNDFIPVLQEECQAVLKWSEDSRLAEENIRSQMILLPFGLGLAYDLPPLAKYSYARDLNAKVYYLLIVLDDYYEVGAAYEDLLFFNEAIEKWDPSIVENLPAGQGPMSIRVLFHAIYNLTNEAARQAKIWHGRDRLQLYIDHWMASLKTYLKERLWADTGYTPNAEKYVSEHAKVSFATETGIPMMYYSYSWENVGLEFLESRPDFRAIYPIGKSGRFLNDARSYQYERTEFKEGKGKAELIKILMMENPTMTEVDAVQNVENLAQAALEEGAEEILDLKVPYPEMKASILANFRSGNLVYYFVDGLRNVDHVLSHIMEPLPDCLPGRERLGLELLKVLDAN